LFGFAREFANGLPGVSFKLKEIDVPKHLAELMSTGNCADVVGRLCSMESLKEI